MTHFSHLEQVWLPIFIALFLGAIISFVATACLMQHTVSLMNIKTTQENDDELKVDDWGIDAIYSGLQKCLSCVPGLSPLSFSEKAVMLLKIGKQLYKIGF